MRRIIALLGILPTFVMLSSCFGSLSTVQEGSLTLVISEGGLTKASDVTQLGYESKVNQLQVFLFEGTALQNYERLDLSGASFPYTLTYPSVRSGSYRIYAVANGGDLSGVTSETALKETVVRLSDCSLDPALGFVMAGSTSVTVEDSEAHATLALQRYAARVRLVSIENQVPESYADGGSVIVEGVFLINALGSWNLAGEGVASEWVNLGGRLQGRQNSDDRSDFLFGEGQVHPAAYRNQVFRGGSVTLTRGSRKEFTDCCLYSFPNSVTGDHTGSSATEATGAMARLVVLARVNGEDWWYPVTLFKDGEGLRRNTTCDVKLTLRATGSGDPNEPVGTGSLEATVSVKGWLTGAKYTETI